MTMHLSHTFTGRLVDPLHLRVSDIDLRDIAHALGAICRFGGHAPKFYSVAEHAVRVAELVQLHTGDPLLSLLALHHDDAEAYLGDVIRPIKSGLGWGPAEQSLPFMSFRDVEFRGMDAIYRALGLDVLRAKRDTQTVRTVIRDADNSMLGLEMLEFWRDLDAHKRLAVYHATDGHLVRARFMSPMQAEAVYLDTHERFLSEVAAVGP